MANILVKMNHKIISTSATLYVCIFTSKHDEIGSRQSEGMSEKSIIPPSTTDKSFDPEIMIKEK